MLRSRSAVLLVVVGLVAVAVPVALAAHTFSSAASPATIAVTLGMPHETTLKVTPSKITASPAVFTVTNKGKLSHSFKVCTKANTGAKATATTCTGVATKKIAPGKTASLTVKFPDSGSYEYLFGTPAEAKAGTKGLSS